MREPTRHLWAEVDGHRLFYREAGPPDAPAVVLLHGFPASSFMFRDLIPALADAYHVVAPDYLGAGFSDAPPDFRYTLDGLADLVAHLLARLGVARFAVYVHDRGASVGWRVLLRDPGAVTAVVTQSGNGYEAGFVPEFWTPVWDYAYDPGPTTEAALRPLLEEPGIRWQYTHGVADASVVSPDAWHRDADLLARPGRDRIQLALLRDHLTDLALYPRLHERLRRSGVPLLAVWGAHDRILDAAGAEAFRADVPDAEVRLVPGGHFLLESHLDVVGAHVRGFLDTHLGGKETVWTSPS